MRNRRTMQDKARRGRGTSPSWPRWRKSGPSPSRWWGGSGRAAVPPTATADPGGFSQPGGGETQETQRLGECGAQVQVGRDAGDPVRVPADGAGGSGRAAVPTPRPRTLEEFLNCKKGAPESVTRLKMERRVIASPDAADRKGWTSFIRV